MSLKPIDEQAILPDPMVLRRLAVSESGFVFDPVSGHSFTVNETGLIILHALQRDSRLNEIRALLSADYDVDPQNLDRDLIEFLGSLSNQLSHP